MALPRPGAVRTDAPPSGARRTDLILAAGLFLLAQGCGRSGSRSGQPVDAGFGDSFGSKAASEVSITSSKFSTSGNHLQVAYVIQNRSAASVYLLETAVLIDSSGVTTVGPARPRVELVDDLAILSDKLFPIPPGTNSYVPPHAYGEELAAGASKSAVVDFPMPLREISAATAGPTEEVYCSRIRFVVGVIHDSPELDATREEFSGKPMWRLNSYAWKWQQELTAESALWPPVFLLVRE